MKRITTQSIRQKTLLLLLLIAGTAASWGQTLAEGSYFIASYNKDSKGNSQYNQADQTNNFYLTAATGCFYAVNGSGVTTGVAEDNGMPFLTTYKSFLHDASADAVWQVSQYVKDGTTYYRFRLQGKQLVANDPYVVGNYRRISVHLEDVETVTDNSLFVLTKVSGKDYYTIRPKDVANSLALNPASNNFDQTERNSSQGNGYGGMIGLGSATDGNSYWYFEPGVSAPTITAADGFVTMSTFTEGATIYYTLDGTTPSSTNGTRYTDAVNIGSARKTVKAIAYRTIDGAACHSAVSSLTVDFRPEIEISALSAITDPEGIYKLSSDILSAGNGLDITFTGTLDGNGYTISGLTSPLFTAAADGAVIKNVTLKDVSISGNGNTGAVCCEATGATRIYNCGIISGTVSGSGYVGGLVGLLGGTSRVVNCYSFADVTGGDTAAGIVGYNSYASKSNDLKTMVMNCMFYGNITGGTKISPVYGGEIITNTGSSKGLNNFNYFYFDAPYSENGTITDYNCALGATDLYLTRYEFYRYALNSNRELAAWYATGDVTKGKGENSEMAKWVLDTSIAKYPILKAQGVYPSVINYEDAPTLGTLSVSITQGSNAPTGASVTTGSKTLTIYDKDLKHHHFNYRTVRLPYYNEVGTGNCTHNKVVTGWKITAVSGSGTQGTFTEADEWGGYNFADHTTYAKDLYGQTGRIFNQGAYFDVPDGVTGISIEPYWADCVYLSDPGYDATYNGYSTKTDVTTMGTRYVNGSAYDINGDDQVVYTSWDNALAGLGSSNTKTVYDYAIVLVGNYHHYFGAPNKDIPYETLTNGYTDKPFTLMSADLDNDNEPDYSYIIQFTQRRKIAPVRFDFLNFPGIGMMQKTSNVSNYYGHGIYMPQGWFEVTNTCVMETSQFEYDNSEKADAPLILQGGIYQQIVSTNDDRKEQQCTGHTTYIHLGGNAWFKEFNNGVHGDRTYFTPHVPISVTGGEYEKFYLSGVYQPNAVMTADDAECYICGGKFGEVAGAGMEPVTGNVTWQIHQADMESFYGGGVNAAKRITGNISTAITDSRVGLFCGGPKFGNMPKKGESNVNSNTALTIDADRTVSTTATGCTFGRFFGAGFGGTSYNRVRADQKTMATNADGWDSWWETASSTKYLRNYSGNGIATNYEYEFILQSGGANLVGRFYVNWASLSLARTNNVTSTLTGCTITENFYGGGNLGSVSGDVTSTLSNCTVGGNVFGAGFSATIPSLQVMSQAPFTTVPKYDGQAGVFIAAEFPSATTYTWSSKGTNESPFTEDGEGNWIHTDVDLTTLGTVTGTATLNITGTTSVAGSVYGGGEESAVGGSVAVNMLGGTVAKDIYGGGALANTNTSALDGSPVETTVNLTGGTVTRNVYGGGLGRNADEENSIEAVAALVGGDVTIALNQDVANTAKGCVVLGSIFGCNNINGTPKGNVTVHVYKTQNAAATQIAGSVTESAGTALGGSPAKEKGRYDVLAVYGGGNQAAYNPTTPWNGTSGSRTQVIIDGCGLTSIGYVYGGGNAAPVPETNVTVNGTYEIGWLFGGGNGAGDGNPGANVGILYAAVPGDSSPGTTYGTGNATTLISGGTIGHLFGGSNERGNIIGRATLTLDESASGGDCPINITSELFGFGNAALMDGDGQLNIDCVSGTIAEVYGGAKAADVGGSIDLHINSGTFGQVFGGNKTSGNISGTVSVTVEETGCTPIIITELYGAGNMAAYTAPDATPDYPQVNIVSCTSIGTVYGGGYGTSAIVTGNPTVNINEVYGKAYEGEESSRTFTATATTLGAIGTVFGGGNAATVNGSTHVNIGTAETVLSAGADTPRNVEGARITGNVFGGGNQAEVTGKSYVTIGRK